MRNDDPTKFERADQNALAAFDPRTKVCTMNCGPTVGDPRSPEERRFLCPDCVTVPVPNADNAMRAVPKDAPVMTAWNNYKSCDDYQNTRKWALHEEHVDGSLWASFYAGYFACAVDTTSAPHSASQPDTVAVPIHQLEHWAEYWNGNANEKSMTDALEHILDEISAVLQAAKEMK